MDGELGCTNSFVIRKIDEEVAKRTANIYTYFSTKMVFNTENVEMELFQTQNYLSKQMAILPDVFRNKKDAVNTKKIYYLIKMKALQQIT